MAAGNSSIKIGVNLRKIENIVAGFNLSPGVALVFVKRWSIATFVFVTAPAVHATSRVDNFASGSIRSGGEVDSGGGQR